MTQQYILKAMAHNYRNGHSWDQLDSEVCMKAAEEIKQLKLMLETMTAERDGLLAEVARLNELLAKEGRHFDAVWQKGLDLNSELTKARELIQRTKAVLPMQHWTLRNDIDEFSLSLVKSEARKSDTWSKEWKECGFNYSVDTAIKALRYLANNERPIGGQETYNSEHLFQIAEELMYTKTELLIKP